MGKPSTKGYMGSNKNSYRREVGDEMKFNEAAVKKTSQNAANANKHKGTYSNPRDMESKRLVKEG